MRHWIAGVFLALVAGCGSDSLLGPVTTCDGQWNGNQNGYALGLNMVQTDSTVTGAAQVTGIFGSLGGTVTGTCSFPTVNLRITVVGYEPLTYIGTMSQTAAKIFARLDGSGFANLEIDISKR